MSKYVKEIDNMDVFNMIDKDMDLTNWLEGAKIVTI